MPKFDFSKIASSLTSAAAQDFARSVNSQKLSGEAAHLLTGAGEKMSQAFVRELASASASYMTSKLSNNSALGDLAGKLVESLVKEISQQAQNQLRAAGGTVRQQAANYLQTPVGSAQPAPLPGPAVPSSQAYMDQAVARMRANEQYRNFVRRMPGEAIPESLLRQPGYRIENDTRHGPVPNFGLSPLPDEGAASSLPRAPFYQRVLTGFSKTYRTGTNDGGGTLDQVGSMVGFVGLDYMLKGALGGVSSALEQTNQLVTQSASLQKNVGNTTGDWRTFYNKVSGAGAGMGYLPADALAAAGVYMPSALRSSASDITQMLRFGTGYGIDPTQWAGQMAQAAQQLGYIGGAKGSMGISNYQGLLAAAYASSSGLAKMGDFTTGFQDLARLMQANTVTSPSLSGANSALQFYVKLNQSRIAGESGSSAGALLGQLNQSIVNGPTSGSPGVQMAFYQALGGSKGISPSELQYITEEGIGGKDLQGRSVLSDLINYGNKMYAGFSPMDKRYAMSKILGLDLHQTQAILGAYGNGGSAFSMSGLNTLLRGAGTSLSGVNDSQLNLLAQLAEGHVGAQTVAREMAQQHVKGAASLFKHGQYLGASKQQLANMIVHGGTVKSEAETTRTATNAINKELQQSAEQLHTFSMALQRTTAGMLNVLNKSGLLNDLSKAAEAHPVATTAGITAAGFVLPKALRAGKNLTWGGLKKGSRWGLDHAFTDGKTPVLPKTLTPAARTFGVGTAGAIFEGAALGLADSDVENYARTHPGWNITSASHMLGLGNVPFLSGAIDFATGGDIAYQHKGGANFGDWLDTHFGLNKAVASSGLKQSILNPVQALDSLLTGIGTWAGGTGGTPPAHRKLPGGGSAILDPQISQRLGQDAQSYRAALGDLYHNHFKAANKTNEDLIGKILNTNAPLDSNTLRTLDDDLSTFVKQFGKGLTSWVQASLTAVSSMSGFGSGSSGSSGSSSGYGAGTSGYGAWSASASGGVGSNTFAGFGQGAKWGQTIGVTLANGQQDTERGAIFTGTTGQAIRLPQAARYDANLSDQYRSIFTLSNGEALSFMHGNMIQSFKNGQVVGAGTVIGRVAPNGDPTASLRYWGTTPTGIRTPYQSTPDIVEFGVYDNAHDAFVRNVKLGTQSLNPYAYLASLGKGPASSLGSGGGGAYPSYFSLVKNGQTSYLRNPQLIKDYVNAAKKYGLDPRALVAQGFQESGWNPKITNTTQGVRDAYGVEYAEGIAQFLPSTARSFGINPFNPDQAIMAQAKYMAQLGARSNLQQAWASYGTGDISNLYASTRMGPLPGGGSAMMGGRSPLRVTIDPLDINIKNADGSRQTIRVQPRVKFAGVVGVHTEPMPTQHAVTTHPAAQALIKR